MSDATPPPPMTMKCPGCAGVIPLPPPQVTAAVYIVCGSCQTSLYYSRPIAAPVSSNKSSGSASTSSSSSPEVYERAVGGSCADGNEEEPSQPEEEEEEEEVAEEGEGGGEVSSEQEFEDEDDDSERAPRKRALVIGINYLLEGTVSALNGCGNDARAVQALLLECGYDEILVMTDDQFDSVHNGLLPTKQNILAAIAWLVKNNRPGDKLFFYFSGHGAQVPDEDGDEDDGFDEAICPSDCDENGCITDDELNDYLVKPLSGGVVLHALIDSCHSGSMLDLQYNGRIDESIGRWGGWALEHSGEEEGLDKDSDGLVVCISGCMDHEYSADASSFREGKITPVSNGAMTYAFIKAIKDGEASTYSSLINAMYHVLRNPELHKEGSSNNLLTKGDEEERGGRRRSSVSNLMSRLNPFSKKGKSNTAIVKDPFTQSPVVSSNRLFPIQFSFKL